MSTEEPSFTPCPGACHHWAPQHSECYERHVCTRSDGSKDGHMSGGLGRNLPRQKLSGGRGRGAFKERKWYLQMTVGETALPVCTRKLVLQWIWNAEWRRVEQWAQMRLPRYHATCIQLLVKYLFSSFSHFKKLNSLPSYYWVKSVIEIVQLQVLCWIYASKHFSHSLGCLFIFFRRLQFFFW